MAANFTTTLFTSARETFWTRKLLACPPERSTSKIRAREFSTMTSSRFSLGAWIYRVWPGLASGGLKVMRLTVCGAFMERNVFSLWLWRRLYDTSPLIWLLSSGTYPCILVKLDIVLKMQKYISNLKIVLKNILQWQKVKANLLIHTPGMMMETKQLLFFSKRGIHTGSWLSPRPSPRNGNADNDAWKRWAASRNVLR